MTFSNNIDAVNTMQKTRKEVPPTFMPSHYRFKDVTVLYSNNFTDKLYISSSLLYHKAQNGKIVYLCGPSWMSWVPLDWTIPDKRGDIVFQNVNIGDIVRLATYDNGQFTLSFDYRRICSFRQEIPVCPLQGKSRELLQCGGNMFFFGR